MYKVSVNTDGRMPCLSMDQLDDRYLDKFYAAPASPTDRYLIRLLIWFDI
jgi:hypothetical protein